jgi:acyl-CoA synthetase (AMP-forming)/AMP-acid ligase II
MTAATPAAAAAAALLAASPRLVDAASGERLEGAGLHRSVRRVADGYAALGPGVVFARTGLAADSVLRYLAALCAGRAVALLDPALDPATLADLVARYRPAAVVGLAAGGQLPGLPAGYAAAEAEPLGPHWRRVAAPDVTPHPDLAVLLATSGSTGSPKLVRLSGTAIVANARSIAEGLGIGPDETAPTSLPAFYSYGLSVLNSHLVRGATVVVADGGVLSRDFWRAVDGYAATSLAGVPHHYEMLARIRWRPATHPSLRSLTQAGGKMRTELTARLHRQAAEDGARLYVMYGQTEATARIAILPAERLADKLGSAGLPIAGGALTVRTDDGSETAKPYVSGEVVYRGPNVMMGYADTAADLARGDDLGGVLATGDLGHLDEEGFLYLTGRVKRIGKVFGVRVNLDDVERLASVGDPVAAVAAGDKVVIWCVGADAAALAEVADRVSHRLRMHRSGFDVRAIDRLPTLSSGKVDYRALTELAEPA